jgi:hypothetical protein
MIPATAARTRCNRPAALRPGARTARASPAAVQHSHCVYTVRNDRGYRLIHPETVHVAASHQAEARRIAAELAAIAASGMVLPGSITCRRIRCGHHNCAFHAEPPRLHGPYWQSTRKALSAATVGRWLSPEQHQDWQSWIDNDRRLRELLSRLEALGTLRSRPIRAGSTGPAPLTPIPGRPPHNSVDAAP